jgi:hypothetical protein
MHTYLYAICFSLNTANPKSVYGWLVAALIFLSDSLLWGLSILLWSQTPKGSVQFSLFCLFMFMQCFILCSEFTSIHSLWISLLQYCYEIANNQNQQNTNVHTYTSFSPSLYLVQPPCFATGKRMKCQVNMTERIPKNEHGWMHKGERN